MELSPVKPKNQTLTWFITANSVVYVMFQYLNRDHMLNKMQLLCRDMYIKKVPLYYKMVTFFMIPKIPAEEHFVNMVRNTNTATHEYRGGVPFSMIFVSIETRIASFYCI